MSSYTAKQKQKKPVFKVVLLAPGQDTNLCAHPPQTHLTCTPHCELEIDLFEGFLKIHLEEL